MGPKLNAREGGVRIVFDVPDHLLEVASAVAAASRFAVRSYYSRPPSRGGSGSGYTRLGAERQRDLFTDQERNAIVAAFEITMCESNVQVVIIGVDTWEAR